MAELSILVPVLNRPHRVRPVIESAAAATPGAEVLFIADPDDAAELEALEAEGADFIAPGGKYSEKINAGVRETDSPLLFFGADDLTFIPGWFEVARSHLSNEIRVVGLNDGVTKRSQLGHHATHFLVTRDYALLPTIDDKRGPLFEGYGHQYVDDEFVGTARLRRAVSFAADARIDHSHYFNGTGVMDATYEKGLLTKADDRRLHRRRRMMWK